MFIVYTSIFFPVVKLSYIWCLFKQLIQSWTEKSNKNSKIKSNYSKKRNKDSNNELFANKERIWVNWRRTFVEIVGRKESYDLTQFSSYTSAHSSNSHQFLKERHRPSNNCILRATNCKQTNTMNQCAIVNVVLLILGLSYISAASTLLDKIKEDSDLSQVSHTSDLFQLVFVCWMLYNTWIEPWFFSDFSDISLNILDQHRDFSAKSYDQRNCSILNKWNALI